MNCCSKSGIQKFAPNSHIHVQIVHRVVMFSSVDPLTIENTASVWWTVAGDTCRLCDHPVLFSLWTSLIYWVHKFSSQLFYEQLVSLSHLLHSSFRFGKVHIAGFLFWTDRFPRGCVHHNPPRHASSSRAWTLDASSGFEFPLIQLSSFPVAVSILTCGCNQTFRGWGTCRKMRRQVHRCVFRFCHTSSPFCSCSLFSIVLVQLIKLEFSAL